MANIHRCLIGLSRGLGTMGARGAQAPQHFKWGPYPCNFEHWRLLIKVANDELTLMTHNKICEFIHFLSKLQEMLKTLQRFVYML